MTESQLADYQRALSSPASTVVLNHFYFTLPYSTLVIISDYNYCFTEGGGRPTSSVHRGNSGRQQTMVGCERHWASVLCVRERPVSRTDCQVPWSTVTTAAACREDGWERRWSSVGDAKRDRRWRRCHRMLYCLCLYNSCSCLKALFLLIGFPFSAFLC